MGLREHGREDSVWTEPFFKTEFFFSTDGAHDTEWAVAGVNHHWMPPGVSEFECVPGTPRDEWRADVGFLGTVSGYHRRTLTASSWCGGCVTPTATGSGSSRATISRGSVATTCVT